MCFYSGDDKFVCNNIQEFSDFLSTLKPKIGYLGGRSFENDKKSLSFNKIVRIFAQAVKNDSEEVIDKTIFRRLRELDQDGFNLLNTSHWLIKAITFARQYFGNLFYNREKTLAKLEFPGKTPVTSRGEYRLLELEGDEGFVDCRVRGDGLTTFPHLSKEWTFEFSLRSFLRLRNLTAVRGDKPGTRMIGPADYYGNIEKPHLHLYTIDIDDKGVPIFLQENPTESQTPKPNSCVKPPSTTVRTRWISNTDPAIQEVRKQYEKTEQPAVGKNIFPKGGILEIQDREEIKLKNFDAKVVDLTPYKARLVKNDVPFQLTSIPLSHKDEFRAISYMFEPNYASSEVTKGGGVTLETHTFSQTMTPLHADASGFITLGKWKDDSKQELEIIAVKVPFGYTLIVDPESIHGDATLSGMYMMLMTSNHETMQTADCVYLKNPITRKNVGMVLDEDLSTHPKSLPTVPLPIAIFKEDTLDNQKRFHQITKETRSIKNILRKAPSWRSKNNSDTCPDLAQT